MARRLKKVNKSEEVRKVLEDKGIETAPKVVIADLKERKITVSAAQVSNIKAALRAKAAGNGSRGKVKGGAGVQEEALMGAKKLADLAGGVDAAKRALDLLARLT